MENSIWFGTRGYMTWVPCPDINGDHSVHGWSSKMQYLSGGAGVRRSTGGHKVYEFSWSSVTRDDIRPVTDYAQGLYDSQEGVNLLYFHDPMTLDYNVLPPLWASPGQAAADGQLLIKGSRPDIVPTGSNTNRFPARSVTYRTNTASRSLWVPISPGFTAWIGAFGTASGAAGVNVTTSNGLSNGSTTKLTMLPPNGNSRFNHSIVSSGTVDGFTLSLHNSGLASNDTLTLTGMMVQIIETGFLPDQTTPFISGQGHSGCQFDGHPIQTPHSAVFDSVSVSATLSETGAWL